MYTEMYLILIQYVLFQEPPGRDSALPPPPPEHPLAVVVVAAAAAVSFRFVPREVLVARPVALALAKERKRQGPGKGQK